MNKLYIFIGIIILLVIIYLAITLIYTVSSNTKNTKSNTITNITKNNTTESFSQDFCVNAVMNKTAMEYALNSGLDCFRTDISLNSKTEAFVASITKNGGNYLGIIDYQTVGAQPSANGCTAGCNWTLSTWNASVYNALKEYPEVNEWEIYNEPLVGEFMSGYENGSAIDYFNMIKSTYTIIKKQEPNATIVCFGGAELFPLNDVQIEYSFYSQVWKYGASKYCDAVSIHAYSLPYYNLSQYAYQNVTLKQVFNFTLMLYENLTKKPIWITETGIPSNNWVQGLNLSEQKQGSFLNQEMLFFSSYPFVKKIYWYTLLGGTGAGADFGLLNSTTLQPKPAWYSFQYFFKK
ncbi:MAG: glycosyl hydrolase [Candidatus Micrarchaeia archaeon]